MDNETGPVYVLAHLRKNIDVRKKVELQTIFLDAWRSVFNMKRIVIYTEEYFIMEETTCGLVVQPRC